MSFRQLLSLPTNINSPKVLSCIKVCGKFRLACPYEKGVSRSQRASDDGKSSNCCFGIKCRPKILVQVSSAQYSLMVTTTPFVFSNESFNLGHIYHPTFSLTDISNLRHSSTSARDIRGQDQYLYGRFNGRLDSQDIWAASAKVCVTYHLGFHLLGVPLNSMCYNMRWWGRYVGTT